MARRKPEPRGTAHFKARWGLLAAAVLAALAGIAPRVAEADQPGPPSFRLETQVRVSRLKVVLDQSQTLTTARAFIDILVANPEIADVMALTDRTVYVLGKKVGTTRLTILDPQRNVTEVVEIEVGYDVKAVEAALRENLPASHIKASLLAGRIMLSGSVADAVAAERAVAIAEQFAPGAVTNSLVVVSPQQVLLEVRFIEASRSVGRDLGINWQAVSRTAGDFAFLTGPLAFPSNNTPFGTLIARLLDGGTNVDVIIQALEERGLARRLAEPNLVALSGDTASFLAGGEFPFPVAHDRDTITIEFKKFGVGLAFTPTVLSRGLINLKIEPEVSEIDPNTTLTVNGTTIPGLVSRRASTTVELRDGQSFAIAGLLQTNHSKAQRQLPWIGQVPVLGALFRSASYEKRETDLVIIVTPRLVQPRGPEQQLATPFDKALPGNDVDFFLGGKQEVWRTHVVPAKAIGKHKSAPPPHGHMLNISRYEPPAAWEHQPWK